MDGVQLSHMFGGVFKITQLTAEKLLFFSSSSLANVDYTDAISNFQMVQLDHSLDITICSGNFMSAFYINVHRTKKTLYLDMEIKEEKGCNQT